MAVVGVLAQLEASAKLYIYNLHYGLINSDIKELYQKLGSSNDAPFIMIVLVVQMV